MRDCLRSNEGFKPLVGTGGKSKVGLKRLIEPKKLRQNVISQIQLDKKESRFRPGFSQSDYAFITHI